MAGILTLVGLVSDSHGHAAMTRRAVALLGSRGAEILLHLGNVGSTDVIDALVIDAETTTSICQSRLVFGNTDYDWEGLERYVKQLGGSGGLSGGMAGYWCTDLAAARLAIEQGQRIYALGTRISSRTSGSGKPA